MHSATIKIFRVQLVPGWFLIPFLLSPRNKLSSSNSFLHFI